ncbi:RPC31 [Auxenochlorella protothecoides x Auxenochlorella symbiontica]
MVDDSGQPIVLGPPPMFPEMDLPEVPEGVSTVTERCLLRRHELQHAWRNSCFHLTPAAFEAAGKKGTGPTPMQELTQILTLDPRYFPQELFGAKDTKASRGNQAGMWAAAAARRQRGEVDELGALEALAAAESRSRVAGGDVANGVRPAEDGEDEAEAAIDEEDEDVGEEEDDYYVNERFDDDDGYDDDFDDGGGDDAIY